MTFKVLKDKIIITLNKEFWRQENYGEALSSLINYLKKDNINKVHVFFANKLTHDWILREFVKDILIRNMNSSTRIIVHCKEPQYYHVIDRINFPKVKVVNDANRQIYFRIHDDWYLIVTITNYATMQCLCCPQYVYTEGE